MSNVVLTSIEEFKFFRANLKTDKEFPVLECIQEIYSFDKMQKLMKKWRNSFLPEIRAVYFLYNDEELIYVGRTINLKRRILKHYASKKEALYFSFVSCQDLSDDELFQLEEQLILVLKPMLNKKLKSLIHLTSKLFYDNDDRC